MSFVTLQKTLQKQWLEVEAVFSVVASRCVDEHQNSLEGKALDFAWSLG